MYIVGLSPLLQEEQLYYRYLLKKTTPGDGYRIWHQCHYFPSSTESSREDLED